MQLESAPPIIDFHAMAKAQPDATDLQHLQAADNAIKFTRVSMLMCAYTLLCDTSTGTPRLIVPKQFRGTPRLIVPKQFRYSAQLTPLVVTPSCLSHTTTDNISLLLVWNEC